MLDALYRSVMAAEDWSNFRYALCEWFGASTCEFHLPEAIKLSGQLAQGDPNAIPNSGSYLGNSAATHEYTALAPMGESRTGLSIYRSPEEPAFDAHERGRLDIVASHLAQAIKLRQTIEKKSSVVRDAKAALEHVPTCIALLGHRGKVLLSSSKFKSVAIDPGQLSILDGYVVLHDPALQARFLDNLEALAARPTAPFTFLLEAVAKERLYCRVRSLQQSVPLSEWPTIDSEAIAVLMLESFPATESPNAARIAESLNLSPAQARLVAGIVAGKSIKDYAFEADISIHTARTHLKKVFMILGVRSQSALVRSVLTRTRGNRVGD